MSGFEIDERRARLVDIKTDAGQAFRPDATLAGDEGGATRSGE